MVQTPRVLIVDDEQAVREVLLAMLSGQFDVQITGDGTEAVGMCTQNDYAAAVIDLALPGKLDGFEVATRVRELRPGTKVVIITGLAVTKEKRDRAATVSDALMEKPFDPDDLMEILWDLLRPAKI